MQRHTPPSLQHRPTTPEHPFPGREAAVHDLVNLVDAASRSVTAARRGADIDRHLPALEAALSQMSDLLAVLSPPTRYRAPRDAGLTVFDAVKHAAQLMRPLAKEQGVAIHTEVNESLSALVAPGLFRTVADCIRNSLESIAVACVTSGVVSGAIVILADTIAGTLRITIADDGGGPSDAVPDPFLAGASSKTGSSGMGLAVASHVVGRLRGTISLSSGAGVTPGRPGALLRISIPVDSLSRLATAA